MIRNVLFFVIAITPPLAAAADAGKTATKVGCPVTGKAVRKDISLSYRGGKIYFCCTNCLKKFKAKRDDFTTNANAQLVATGQAVQTACPITGEDLKRKRKLKIAGVDVYFCCVGCQGKVANAEKEIQLYLVFGNNAFARGFKIKSKNQPTPDAKK